jgi:NADPH2:quinone reductase
MDTFKALRIYQEDGRIVPRLEQLSLDQLSPGDVVIRGEYSSVNYKDALAATGAGRILRRFPLVGGVDVAGTVVSSSDPRCKPGDRVVVTGGGLSETHDGGFSEYVRVPGEWVIPLPEGLDTRTAMSFGTAGFTAAFAIHRLERNGQTPDLGPVIVTGATGGVGSFAVAMLAERGYQVTALTRKTTASEYLQGLGARAIMPLQDVDAGTQPLKKATWGGAIDNLGGATLAWLTRTTVNWGSIASVGLTQGTELNTTVLPFILRGVSVIGINAVEVPRQVRLEIWQRLAGDLKPAALGRIASREIDLDQLIDELPAWIDGTVIGRCLVRLG